ncbi:MAG: septal ring lytic transglycosylase RlpA family protein [Candidatus Omnitrophica bacterium]|nr:septal ring lytic transglycosylase RlpA family protein [Candidatus Omnitrophota bacterium]
MLRIKIKFLGPLLSVAILFLGLLVWAYVADLRSRFPELDLSRSRLGIASWYSRTDPNINEFTASGERFNDRDDTCATWDFPFGERLLVINTLSGKWVVCRVNDRGPNKRLRREIDLTKAAFKKIANTDRGLTVVAVIPVAPEKRHRTLG